MVVGFTVFVDCEWEESEFSATVEFLICDPVEELDFKSYLNSICTPFSKWKSSSSSSGSMPKL